MPDGRLISLRAFVIFALQRRTMAETIYADDYLDYQANRSRIRKIIRKIYLWQVRRHVIGNAIDFGCGVGEHLSTFSKDSLGLEINESTVKYCQSKNLNVKFYDPESDNYQLKNIEPGKFQTLVISHVLEHLDNPEEVLKKLINSAEALGIRRIFVVVPCEKGFAHDKTHRTFVTKDYLQDKHPEAGSGFRLTKSGYFPFNSKSVGKWFVYNELYLMYDRA